MSTNPSAQKVLIIGLDCADPVLMFDRFIDRLPNIRSLTQRGLYGQMESCTPPITVPAWTCMATSKDPGQHGCYGFRNRADWSYNKLTFATNANIDQLRIWDIIGQDGKASVILGVPQTYPPRAINGSMISCFLTPSTESNYTYPLELKAEIEPDYTIELSPEEKRLMKVRARQKYRKPEFNKHDSHKKKRVASSWRRPQGQHNKQRHHFASKGKRVQAGFGSPKSVRGRHPSGFEEVLINYPEELTDIKPTQAVRIAGTVGLRKRLNIEVKCQQLNIILLNPSNLVWEMEEEENTGEKGEKSGKEE